MDLRLGSIIALDHAELRGAPARPGLVVPVRRGAHELEAMVLAVEDSAEAEGEMRYRAEVIALREVSCV